MIALDYIASVTATVEPGGALETPAAFIARVAVVYPGFGRMHAYHTTSPNDMYTIENGASIHGVCVHIYYSATQSSATIAVMHTVPRGYWPTISIATAKKRGGPAQAWAALHAAVERARDVVVLLKAGSKSTIRNLVADTAGTSRTAQADIREVLTDNLVLEHLEHFLA